MLPDEQPPHALTFRCRDLWASAIERGTAVPIAEVQRDPTRFLVPGNLLMMARGALPVAGSIGADGHVGRIEGYSGGLIRTVDGNVGDQVARREYELADPHLVGVVLYPGGDTLDTWQPSEAELDEMITAAARAFGERS